MAMIYGSNKGLVKYCETALKYSTVYMWGGLFRRVTLDYINQLSTLWKTNYTKNRVDYLKSLITTGLNWYGCDCIGLVKSYYFGGVGTANIKGYKAEMDLNVGTMYKAANKKGIISELPTKRPKVGQLVMVKNLSHVGVYAGNNKVIECTIRGNYDGVVKTNFNEVDWYYWVQCPYIKDDSTETDPPHVDNKPYPTPAIFQSLGSVNLRTSPEYGNNIASKTIRNKLYVFDDIIHGEISGGSDYWLVAGDDNITTLYAKLFDFDGSALFRFIKPVTKLTANAIVNVREKPSLNGKIVRKLKAGDIIYATDITYPADNNGNAWVQVLYNGNYCYTDRRWYNEI